MALLVLSRNREGWREIADELSAYYNTPGRLAVFRRRFEDAHRRPGSDPATFATELGILALRGFSDMTEKGRDLMVRDKFIASQRSCDLRRPLDGAAPETSILDIADSGRVWESHGEPADIEDRSRILPIPARTISKSKSGVESLGPATIGLPRRTDHGRQRTPHTHSVGSSERMLGGRHERRRRPRPVFFMRIPWTWDEPLHTARQILPLHNAGMVG